MSLLSFRATGSTERAPAERGVPAERGAPARPPLRLIEPEAAPRARARRPGLIGTALVGALFLAVLALAAMHSLVVQAQFQLDDLHGEVATRRDRVEELRLTVAERESPEAIVAAAEALGMVRPAERVYLVPVRPGAAVVPAPGSVAPTAPSA
ncbi:MAG TPA: hypothetical protein VK866_04330 [Acidimicrobiales bacterium]|nr:hypothetical protein [Acidimicrobiales bacterium]